MFGSCHRRFFTATLRRGVASKGLNPPLVETHGVFLSHMARVSESKGSVTLHRLDGTNTNSGIIAELVFQNTNKRGAINSKMMLELGACVDKLEEMDDLNAIILRGAGNNFCAGLDLELARTVINSPEMGILMSDYMSDCLNRIQSNSAVSVCLINGPAIGGGSELITSTDYRIMLRSSGVKIQSVHARIGASPGWGGALRLKQLIGRRHALTCLGASTALDADAALAIGLVDRIVDAPLTESTDAFLTKTGADFLRRFLPPCQVTGSVRGIKFILSAQDDKETHLREQEVFYDRWFCEDNVKAIERSGKK